MAMSEDPKPEEGKTPIMPITAKGAPNFQHVASLTGHSMAVATVKFCPAGGNQIATGSADKTVKIWQTPPCSTSNSTDSTPSIEASLNLSGHSQGISDVAWIPDGRYVCSASDDHTLKLWDVEAGKCLKTLRGHTNFVFCCAFDPQGHLLASGSFDETLRVWCTRSGRCLREIPAHSDPVTSVDFNHDGTLIASSSLDGLMRIWDTHSGHCLKTLFDKDSPPVSSVKFCPNSKYILSGSLDSRLRLWNFEKGRAVRHYQGGHTNSQYCLFSTFSSAHVDPAAPTAEDRSPWIVTGSEDNSLCVYHLGNKQIAQRIPGRASPEEPGPGHCDIVLSVDAHPTRSMIVSGAHTKDCTAKLWEHRPISTDA